MNGDIRPIRDALYNRWVAGFSALTLSLGGIACGEQQSHKPTDPQQVRQLGTRVYALWHNGKLPVSAKREGAPDYSWAVRAADGTELRVHTRSRQGNTGTIDTVGVTRDGKTCDLYDPPKDTTPISVACSQGNRLLFSTNGNQVHHEGEPSPTQNVAEAQADRQEALTFVRSAIDDAYRRFGVS
jgi:hypothetical protein